MKPDNLVLKWVTSRSSDRVVKLIATLVEISQNIENAISHIQLFITKQQVYFWQILSVLTYLILFKNLLLFANVWNDTWTNKMIPTSPIPYQRYSNFRVFFLIQLFIPAISAHTEFSLG